MLVTPLVFCCLVHYHLRVWSGCAGNQCRSQLLWCRGGNHWANIPSSRTDCGSWKDYKHYKRKRVYQLWVESVSTFIFFFQFLSLLGARIMLSNSPDLCQVLKAFSTALSDALGIREKPWLLDTRISESSQHVWIRDLIIPYCRVGSFSLQLAYTVIVEFGKFVIP